MELRASEGSEIRTGGDLAGENITKTITHNSGTEGVTTSQLWGELLRLRQECEADKETIRKEMQGMGDKLQLKVDNIQGQRLKDMRFAAGLIGVLLLGIVVFVYSMLTPMGASANVNGTQAFPQEVLTALEAIGNPSPPPNEYDASFNYVDNDQHCIVQAVPVDSVTPMTEPECFSTLNEALAALAEATGYDKEGLVILIENAKLFAGNDGVYKGMAQYSAVIGAWFACANYTCSSTVVYGGANGCHDGSTWGVPIINQTVNSALKMAGCWTNTLHSSYYFGGAVQWCNCPTVALTVVSSAKYSP